MPEEQGPPDRSEAEVPAANEVGAPGRGSQPVESEHGSDEPDDAAAEPGPQAGEVAEPPDSPAVGVMESPVPPEAVSSDAPTSGAERGHGDADVPDLAGAQEPSGHGVPVHRLGQLFRPSISRSQLMVGLLCGLLGFALVVQVRQTGQEALSSLRQDDLVRLLDEVTVRADQLDGEVSRLQSSRDELASGSGQAQAALEVARQRATTEGILSGRLPAEGPGVLVTIREPGAGDHVLAQHLFNLLEELRNAGAEVVQVNDVRLVASSSFVDGSDGSILVDGTPLTRPYRWRVIGDPATIDRALEIPGGALPTIRTAGGVVATEQSDAVTVDAVVQLTDPQFARPAPDANG